MNKRKNWYLLNEKEICLRKFVDAASERKQANISKRGNKILLNFSQRFTFLQKV